MFCEDRKDRQSEQLIIEIRMIAVAAVYYARSLQMRVSSAPIATFRWVLKVQSAGVAQSRELTQS